MNRNFYRLFLVGLIAVLVMTIWYLLGPSPYRHQTVNVSSRSFGAAWITKNPAIGCIWWGTMWPPRVSHQCDTVSSQTHLVSVRNLQPNRSYWYLISGQGRWYLQSYRQLTTFIDPVEPPQPQVAYGSVIDLKGKPIREGLVFVYPQFYKLAYPQAVRANSAGNFIVDLGIFSEPDTGYVIEGGAGLSRWEARYVGNITTPFPPLEVSSHD